MHWIRSNTLGLVAIVLALGGSAVAAQAVNGDGAQTAAKKKAKRGPAGPAGPAGAAGSAVAFAHVSAAGTLDTANSKNVSSSVLTGGTGYYCVTPSVPVRNFVVSADAAGVAKQANASFDDPFTSCPGGAVVVSMYTGAGAAAAGAFYIAFN